MSQEAFTNSDELYKHAFAQEEPLPHLLKLINEHPTFPSLRDLVVAYTEAVEDTPSRGQFIASTLAKLGASSEAPTLSPYDTFPALINRELADQHFKTFDSGETREWGPRNDYLLESLLSGLSLKNHLTSTSDMLAAVDDGLNASPNDANAQELVVGASIQILLAGSVLASDHSGSYKKSGESVASKLKAQKSAGTVKDPKALHVLELAIAHAETGLRAENDIDDVFSLLFPAN